MTKRETDKSQALRQAFQMHRDKMNMVRRREEIQNSIKKMKDELKDTTEKIIALDIEFNAVMTKASEGQLESERD